MHDSNMKICFSRHQNVQYEHFTCPINVLWFLQSELHLQVLHVDFYLHVCVCVFLYHYEKPLAEPQRALRVKVTVGFTIKQNEMKRNLQRAEHQSEHVERSHSHNNPVYSAPGSSRPLKVCANEIRAYKPFEHKSAVLEEQSVIFGGLFFW